MNRHNDGGRGQGRRVRSHDPVARRAGCPSLNSNFHVRIPSSLLAFAAQSIRWKEVLDIDREAEDDLVKISAKRLVCFDAIIGLERAEERRVDGLLSLWRLSATQGLDCTLTPDL